VDIPIVNQDFTSGENGEFKAIYETSNGIKSEMSGENVAVKGDPAKVGIAMTGYYEYTAPDQSIVRRRWYADSEGFRQEDV